MVNIDVEDSRVACADGEVNARLKCDENYSCMASLSKATDPCEKSASRSKKCESVALKMWRDKVKVESSRKSLREARLREEAARWVGYDPGSFSGPFKGRSRDFRAVIAAVRFKQVVLKHTSRDRCLMKEAILANTMKRAEDDLFIRGRQRQLRRAQAAAEARALEEANSCSNENSDDLRMFMDDEALQSLDLFMQSLSSTPSTGSVVQ